MIQVSRQFAQALSADRLGSIPQFASITASYTEYRALVDKCRRITGYTAHTKTSDLKDKVSYYIDALAYIESHNDKIDDDFIARAYKYNGLYIEPVTVEEILVALDANAPRVHKYNGIVDAVIRIVEIHKYHTAGRQQLLNPSAHYWRKKLVGPIVMNDVRFCIGDCYRICEPRTDSVYTIDAGRLSGYDYGEDYNRYVSPVWSSISSW